MNLKTLNAKEAYLNVSKSSKKDYLLAFKYLLIEQKRYLDNELTLESIAKELKVSQGHLSRLLNSNMNMSFNDYVNSLRVNEAKIHLHHPNSSEDSIFKIGMKSGFNSKSTFYASFKKLTGFTPKQFKNNSLNKSEMMI